MTVTLRQQTFYGITHGTDSDPHDAVQTAMRLLQRNPRARTKAHTAVVDTTDGLCVLIDDATDRGMEGRVTGWHFATATCGDEDASRQAAAKILVLFGFFPRVADAVKELDQKDGTTTLSILKAWHG